MTKTPANASVAVIVENSCDSVSSNSDNLRMPNTSTKPAMPAPVDLQPR